MLRALLPQNILERRADIFLRQFAAIQITAAAASRNRRTSLWKSCIGERGDGESEFK